MTFDSSSPLWRPRGPGSTLGEGATTPVDGTSGIWQAAQSVARVGNFVWDVDTGHVRWSESLYRLLGYNEDQPLDLDWIEREVHHPDDREEVRAWLKACVAGESEELAPREYRVVTAPGSTLYVRTTGLIQRDPDGTLVFGTLQDISELRQAAESTRAALQEIELAVETAGLGIWRLHLETNRLRWNDQLLDIYGLTREEFEEDMEGWRSQLHPEDAATAEAAFSRIVEGESVFDVEFRIRRPDGEIRHLRASGSPVRDDRGEVVELLGINIDVTEIRRGQEALARREAFLDAIVANSPAGIIVADDEGRYRSVNEAAAELLGSSAADLTALSVADLADRIRIRTSEEVEADEQYRSFVEHGEDAGEVEIIRPDGSRRLARYRAIHIAPDFNLSILDDITRLRRAEQEDRKVESLRSLGVMAGGIAHDFNNIMTAVIGNLDLLRPHLESRSEATELLDEARAAADQTRGLARRLLTFAQGGGPMTAFHDLEAVVRDGVESVVSGTTVQARYAFDPELPAVEVDRNQMAQVMSHLASNAVQAMPRGGILHVRGRLVRLDGSEAGPLSTGSFAELTLRDEGHGMAPDLVARIFEPYFTTREMGHGLGLAICHSIVKKHGGHVRAESEPERGTTIFVHLPVSDPDRQTAADPS